MGFFHPLQLLQTLSGSELQLHKESSSKRSESSKLKRSTSSQSSIAAATSPPPSPPERLPVPATFKQRKNRGVIKPYLDPQPLGHSPLIDTFQPQTTSLLNLVDENFTLSVPHYCPYLYGHILIHHLH
uniref:Uncharacterized protein n=1 Tax=Photinus pyralis TaxID=7054 RepID=A0A1Y1LRA9_PHOPY